MVVLTESMSPEGRSISRTDTEFDRNASLCASMLEGADKITQSSDHLEKGAVMRAQHQSVLSSDLASNSANARSALIGRS